MEPIGGRFGSGPEKLEAERIAVETTERDGVVSVTRYRLRIPDEARMLMRTICAVFHR